MSTGPSRFLGPGRRIHGSGGLGFKTFRLLLYYHCEITQRLHSSSFLGLPSRILNTNPKKEVLWSPNSIMVVEEEPLRDALEGPRAQSMYSCLTSEPLLIVKLLAS